MRLYATVAAGGFRRHATYRMATVAGVFTNTVFGFILSYTYIALWDERPRLGGYEMPDALAYVWIGQALLATCGLMGGGFQEEVMERIRTGDIAVDLYRPADLQAWWFSANLGRSAYQLLGRGVAPMAVGALVFDLRLPSRPGTWAAFVLAVALGSTVSFAIWYLVAMSAFWFLDGQGVAQVAWLGGLFFSGMLLPLNVFPGALGEVARVLPWASMLQIPADVFLERYEGWGLLGAYAFQACWAVVLLGAGRVAQWAATRKVVVQGG
ncbi:ABC-2 family transporter protein [Streptomyces sp. NPDC008121]|uniref:ABC transporter permease n=1 Tax=Streptomyces sp. NPDC008121 TaxID=3364809 RepID=UPI0036F17785